MKPHTRKPCRRNAANAAARAERRSGGKPPLSKYARKLGRPAETAKDTDHV